MKPAAALSKRGGCYCIYDNGGIFLLQFAFFQYVFYCVYIGNRVA